MSSECPGTRFPCKPFVYRKFDSYPCKKNNEAETPAVEEYGEHYSDKVEPQETEEQPRNYTKIKRERSLCHSQKSRSSCKHKYHAANLTWYRKFFIPKEEKEELPCVTPPRENSFDVLCRIPICPPKVFRTEPLRVPFSSVHCVFCNESLYYRGTICDLREKIPAVKKESEEKDDDISYRIGDRTQITVHKSCYEEYIKRVHTVLESFEDDQMSDSENSCNQSLTDADVFCDL